METCVLAPNHILFILFAAGISNLVNDLPQAHADRCTHAEQCTVVALSYKISTTCAGTIYSCFRAQTGAAPWKLASGRQARLVSLQW